MRLFAIAQLVVVCYFTSGMSFGMKKASFVKKQWYQRSIATRLDTSSFSLDSKLLEPNYSPSSSARITAILGLSSLATYRYRFTISNFFKKLWDSIPSRFGSSVLPKSNILSRLAKNDDRIVDPLQEQHFCAVSTYTQYHNPVAVSDYDKSFAQSRLLELEQIHLNLYPRKSSYLMNNLQIMNNPFAIGVEDVNVSSLNGMRVLVFLDASMAQTECVHDMFRTIQHLSTVGAKIIVVNTNFDEIHDKSNRNLTLFLSQLQAAANKSTAVIDANADCCITDIIMSLEKGNIVLLENVMIDVLESSFGSDLVSFANAVVTDDAKILSTQFWSSIATSTSSLKKNNGLVAAVGFNVKDNMNSLRQVTSSRPSSALIALTCGKLTHYKTLALEKLLQYTDTLMCDGELGIGLLKYRQRINEINDATSDTITAGSNNTIEFVSQIAKIVNKRNMTVLFAGKEDNGIIPSDEINQCLRQAMDDLKNCTTSNNEYIGIVDTPKLQTRLYPVNIVNYMWH